MTRDRPGRRFRRRPQAVTTVRQDLRLPSDDPEIGVDTAPLSGEGTWGRLVGCNDRAAHRAHKGRHGHRGHLTDCTERDRYEGAG
jgi:hypothetical protein